MSPAPGLQRAQTWLRRALLDAEPPPVAVEVRATSVGVVRVRREGGRDVLASAASVELPPDVLQVSMTQVNVLDAERFRAALRGALERGGVLGGARAALVLPDPIGRVVLMPASEARGRRSSETDELVRFRLKKGVPFEIREARVAHLAPPRPELPYLVAAAPGPVVAEYEAASVSLGLDPGAVELAGLALLRSVFAGAAGDRLLVNWDVGYATVLLARDGWPLVFRTLTGSVADDPAEVAREAAQTLLYYRERLGGTGLTQAVVRCAGADPADALAALREPLGLEPQLLAPWRALGSFESGAAAQTLAGAAAAVGRAA